MAAGKKTIKYYGTGPTDDLDGCINHVTVGIGV